MPSCGTWTARWSTPANYHYDAWRETHARPRRATSAAPSSRPRSASATTPSCAGCVDPAISDDGDRPHRRREGGALSRPGAPRTASPRCPARASGCARLAAAGWRQAIASSGPRANTEAIIDALGLHGVFAAVVAAEDVVHGKPHPEVVSHRRGPARRRRRRAASSSRTRRRASRPDAAPACRRSAS